MKLIKLVPENRGLIYKLLTESYASYPDPARKQEWEKGWKKYDDEVFNNFDTVGACCILSAVEGNIIGFTSWDPRRFPMAVVGHNCVLPLWRGNGYGMKQLSDLISRLREQGFERLKVTTGADDFFEPARKMYRSCGFTEVKRNPDTVDFELGLSF